MNAQKEICKEGKHKLNKFKMSSMNIYLYTNFCKHLLAACGSIYVFYHFTLLKNDNINKNFPMQNEVNIQKKKPQVWNFIDI